MPFSPTRLRALRGAGYAVAALLCLPAVAVAAPREISGLQCEDAVRVAARSTGNPMDLMAAIAQVESGRPDATGVVRPWPWTINAEGKGMFFNSKAEAIATVRLLQANGMRSIDVGCMQVNLMHHPDAFASLDDAFDPHRNAAYAGRFLGQLFQQSKNWLAAAGMYHSSGTPALATRLREGGLRPFCNQPKPAGSPRPKRRPAPPPRWLATGWDDPALVSG